MPACVRMLLALRNTLVEEDEIAATWTGSSRGFALADAAQYLNAKSLTLDPDSPTTYPFLRAHLAQGWAIVQLFSAVLGEADRQRCPPPPPPTGPHGVHSSCDLGLHAVVLVDASGAGYSYLDPFYTVGGQPLLVSAATFVRAFQGQVVLG